MRLSAGTKLGLYEVVGILGVGGMGEVYRARDTKLGREVAVKVLPEAIANDPDRIARFEREAKVLASLNHPHIAALYGMDESAGRHVLIMELVEGETIAERLAAHGSRLPLHEVLTIARQIAAALEAAHEKGVVHRDLKPANVKITPDEKVKVLDFGLAKLQAERAGEAGTAGGDLTNSPTLTLAATQAGIILGTAAYMSPEQAKGRVADKRSDVWSFGCVLYEMLTGKRAFDGEDLSDTLAAVLRSEPDWTALSADVPAPIRALVQGCLRKDRTQRISDVSTALFLLSANESLTAPAAAATTPARGAVSRRRERVWAAAAVAFLLIAAILAIRVYIRPQPEARTLRFDVFAPEGAGIAPGQPLSPDGRMLAFVAAREGKPLIWIRPLDSSTARPLLDTDDASGIFWSPDSQFIGFFAHGQLRKVAVTGGMVQTVCNEAGQDGAWSADNVILFGGQGKPLLRVAAAGGQPIPVTDLAAQETTHFPAFLPDGRHFLYQVRRGPNTQTWKWYIGSLDSKNRRLLTLPTYAKEAKYSSSGHIVFAENETLMAQAFDIGRFELSGDAFPVVEGASPSFSISTTGSLAYVVAGGGSQLVWFDRSGKQLGLAGPKGEYINPELSPDGKQVAFGRSQGQQPDLWVRDIDKGLDSRFTSDPAADYTPVWSPDGNTIAFYSERDRGSLWARRVGVIGDDTLLLESPIGPTPADWSRDGHYLVYQDKGNLWALPSPVSADSKPLRVAATSASSPETSARLSPDGRWVAYQSNQSGQLEVYIQSFPHRGIQQQVSTAGGQQPRWSADGKELFYYVTSDFMLMAVPMAPTTSSPGAGIPMRLFQTRMATGGLGRNYSVAADGRFLINVTTTNQAADPITVVFNWFGELKARAPAR